MRFADATLPEFDQEMANTRKVLERVPDDKLDWRPHSRSNTIGWNASHLAEIPGWVELTFQGTEFDVAPVGGEPYRTVTLSSRDEILARFDRNVAAARRAIQNVADDALEVPWSLLQAGQPIFTLPRGAVFRSMILNHTIHHRAILCASLRLNDIPVPGMYGPSGDE